MKPTIFLFVFIGLQFNVLGSHHARNEGGDIQFSHIDSGRYEIFLTYYIRCTGYGISSPTLVVSGGNQNLNVSTSLHSKTNITAEAVGCQVGQLDSNCNTLVPNDLFEKWVFNGTVDLGQYNSICSWLIESPSLIGLRDNITGSTGQSWFIYANLDRCHGDFSSPVFNGSLVMNFMRYRDQIWDVSVRDTAEIGDSISYELARGYQSRSSGITYTGQYSEKRPINFFGFPNQNLMEPAGFRLEQDGHIHFRPMTQGKSPIVVKVFKWKRVGGQMQQVSMIMRDVEPYTYAPSSNAIPNLKQDNGQPLPVELFILAGDSLTITLGTSDPDSLNKAFIDSIEVPSFATASLQRYTGTDTLSLVFKPDSSQLSAEPYIVRIRLREGACPEFGYRSYLARVYVIDMLRAYPSFDSTLCGTWIITTDSFSGNLIQPGKHPSLEWEIFDTTGTRVTVSSSDSFQMQEGTGPYKARLTYSYGTYSWNDSFNLAALTEPGGFQILSDSVRGCSTDTTFLGYRFQGGTSIYDFIWSGGVSGEELFPTDSGLWVLSNSDRALINYRLTMQVTGACYRNLGRIQYYQNVPTELSLPDTVFVCTGLGRTLKVDQRWYDDITWSTGSKLDSIHVLQQGIYTVSVEDQLGLCPTESDTSVALAYADPDVSSVSDTTFCDSGVVYIRSTDGKPYEYLWDGVKGDSFFNLYSGGQYEVLARDSKGCETQQVFHVQIEVTPSWAIVPASPIGCIGDSVKVSASAGPAYQWSNGSEQSFAFYPVESSGTLRIETPLGCFIEDSFYVDVYPKVSAGFSFTQQGNRVEFLPNATTHSHFWDFGDGDSSWIILPKHTYAGPGNYQVFHRVTSLNGCITDTIQMISVLAGVSDLDRSGEWQVWPNPAKDELLIEFQNAESIENARATLITLDGRKLSVVLTPETRQTALVKLPSGLAAGVYLVVISTEKGNYRKKVQIHP